MGSWVSGRIKEGKESYEKEYERKAKKGMGEGQQVGFDKTKGDISGQGKSV